MTPNPISAPTLFESRQYNVISALISVQPLQLTPQGLAAGLMLSISVFDLFQESAEAVGTG